MLKLLLLFMVSLCIFEGFPLYRERKWKELITFGSLLGISLILTIGKALDMPTPVELIQGMLEPIGKAIFKPF